MGIIVAILVVLLFLTGDNIISAFGWHYSSPDASLVQKIHPLLFIFLPIALLSAFRGKAAGLASRLRVTWWILAYTAYIFIFFILTLITTRLSKSEAGGELSQILVTLIMPIAVFSSFAFVKAPQYSLIAVSIRCVLLVNSLVAILEQVLHRRFLPIWYSDYSHALRFDWRSGGFLGHPLNSATVTGLLIMYLVIADGRKFYRRIPEISLHAVAMFAFGGRAALINIILIVVLRVIALSWQMMSGRSGSITRYLLGAVAALGVALVALPLPFFQKALDRFQNDHGSSQTRVDALRMFLEMPPGSLLFGMSATEREALFLRYKLISGVESAWGTWIIDYGLLASLAIMILLFAFLFRLTRILEPSARYMLLYFLAVTTTSLSLGSKSLLLSEFIAIVLCFCADYSVLDVATPIADRRPGLSRLTGRVLARATKDSRPRPRIGGRRGGT